MTVLQLAALRLLAGTEARPTKHITLSSRSDGFRLGGVHPTPSSVGSTPLRVNDPTYSIISDFGLRIWDWGNGEKGPRREKREREE